MSEGPAPPGYELLYADGIAYLTVCMGDPPGSRV